MNPQKRPVLHTSINQNVENLTIEPKNPQLNNAQKTFQNKFVTQMEHFPQKYLLTLAFLASAIVQCNPMQSRNIKSSQNDKTQKTQKFQKTWKINSWNSWSFPLHSEIHWISGQFRWIPAKLARTHFPFSTFSDLFSMKTFATSFPCKIAANRKITKLVTFVH